MITFREISRTINTAITSYAQYEEVRCDLTSCITGLRNLKKTYAVDKHAQATLEQIIATVECAIGRVGEPLPVVNFPVVSAHTSINRGVAEPRAAAKPHTRAKTTSTVPADVSQDTQYGSSIPLVAGDMACTPRHTTPVHTDVFDEYGDDLYDSGD